MPRDFCCYDGKTTQSRAALMGKIGMFSTGQRPHYLITGEIEPARFGSALGWLMHVDGDTHRNAFLNSPWVKAILPIRPGRERERDAITSLQCQEIAGTESLNEPYPYDAKPDTPEYKNHSMKEVLLMIEDKIASKYADSPKPVPLEDPKMKIPSWHSRPRLSLPMGLTC